MKEKGWATARMISHAARYISQTLGIKPSFKKKQELKGGTAGLTDYNEYEMTLQGKMTVALLGGAIMAAIAIVFYKHIAAVILFSAAGLYFPVMRRKALIKKRKAQLKLQFKQMLAALSSALGAGRSVESAMAETLTDLKMLYPDSGAMIVKELEMIVRRIENGETVESGLLSFSRRAHIEEIGQFTEVFVTCKRTGGNLIQVIRRTAGLLQDKLDMEQDIQVLLAQKRFESKVLVVAPVILIASLAWSTPDYMEPLYQGGGRLIMTGSLIVLFMCLAWVHKIMDIKV